MDNTKRIIEAICQSTSFHPGIKAGLMNLHSNDVEIGFWNALREDEQSSLQSSISKAFSDFQGSISGPIKSATKDLKFSDWSEKAFKYLPDQVKGSDNRKEYSPGMQAHVADKNKWLSNSYRGIKQIDRTDSIQSDVISSRSSSAVYKDVLSGTEGVVGATNITNYIEKISNDVQTFVKLVTLLMDQVIKEAWIKSPESIQSVLGSRLYFMEQAALAIRGKNIDEFTKEANTALSLARSMSIYFILDRANNDVKASLESSWDDIQKEVAEISKNAPPQLKGVLATFVNEMVQAVWESIPAVIDQVGDEFFLILESDSSGIYDPFDSSRLQAYHPIFDVLYKELSDKKPFNWLLSLEGKLNDSTDVDRNLSICGSELVKQGIADGGDFSFPSIGKISGFTSHMFLQKAQSKSGGLAELLGIKESLWITSSYVPGMFGLILLLYNVSCSVLFVAYAEDMVGISVDSKYKGLPIWERYRTSAFDVSSEIAKQKKTEEKSVDTKASVSPESGKGSADKVKLSI